MNSIALRFSRTTLLDRLGRTWRGAADSARATAQRFNAWLTARKASAAARRDLSEMSDYELSDIGLRRWDIDAVARGESPRSE